MWEKKIFIISIRTLSLILKEKEKQENDFKLTFASQKF